MRCVLPRTGGPSLPEYAEPGQVDRGGEQGEVGANLDGAANAGTAAAVATAHQVSYLAFPFRPGGGVVGAPGRVGLGGAGPGQLLLVGAEGHGAPGR
jgi:hypothetical protein